MKKILTAMGNAMLNNELKRYNDYNVYNEDLFYQDAVEDVIAANNFDVLIISALLQGQYEFTDFIEKIRKRDKAIRIIVITDEINPSFQRKLKEANVADVFADNDIQIDDILDAINREETLKNKIGFLNSQINTSSTNVNEEKKNYDIKDNNCDNSSSNIFQLGKQNIISQKQEIITISGINGAGKSTISANFARVLASKSTSKVLLIDLDTLNGNVDEVLEINKIPSNIEMIMDENKKCGLNYAAELMTKNRFDTNVFEEIVIRAGDIDVLTGNTSLHYCQNVLNTDNYDKILNCAKEKYDFIIIDTSSNIFLDSTKWALQVASKIFFITENNYISMKKSSQLLNIFTETWGIWKEKIHIIVNKESLNGIAVEVIQRILHSYSIIGKIKQNEEQLEINYFKILESIHYIPRESIFQRMFSLRPQNLVTTNRIPISGKSQDRRALNVN